MTALPAPSAAAMLEHLTGTSRGNCSWITGDEAGAWLAPDGRLRLAGRADGPAGMVLAARLRRVGAGFVIEAPEGAALWVNGNPVRRAELRHRDMIEFGDTGPLSRFRVFDETHRPHATVGDIMGNTLSYMRTSRRPLHRRVSHAAADTARRLAVDTTMLFRGGVLLALAVLAIGVFGQYRASQRLAQQIESRDLRIETIAAALADARRDAISESDLDALGTDLRARVQAASDRLQTLEARSGAAARIIARTAGSVAFVQGGYGLRDGESGRMLRRAMGPDGVPLIGPGGQPRLTLDGDGPVAEVQFNGTGFLVGDGNVLITNRHVARPWEKNPGMRLPSDAMEPVLTRFIAYFPGRPDPVEVVEAALSDESDLAALIARTGRFQAAGLGLAPSPPRPGDQIIVMGYPTGLMSLLAQSGPGFVEELRAAGETGFWAVAARLAASGLIAPLSSGGIVGQATGAAIVYDAETTHGGSGGPVLNLRGEVVAVNAAIIPEFGGSNLGVPATRIAPLLEGLAPDG